MDIFAFDPETLEVSPGDKVVFSNMDGAPHTATASCLGPTDTRPPSRSLVRACAAPQSSSTTR